MSSTKSLQARSELVVEAPARDAFVSLQLATDIPLWWPLVRGVRRLPDAYELTCRAPFVGDLTLVVRASGWTRSPVSSRPSFLATSRAR
jgi:hypothetical protein